MSKRAYTQTPRHFTRHIKSAGVDVDTFIKVTEDSIIRAIAKHGDRHKLTSDLLGTYCGVMIENAALSTKAMHIYLPDKLFCDWLVDCTPALLPEYFQVIAAIIPEDIGVLHFPTNSNLRPVMFTTLTKLIEGGQLTGLKCGNTIRVAIDSNAHDAPYIVTSGAFNGQTVDEYDQKMLNNVSECVAEITDYDTTGSAIRSALINNEWYVKLIAGIALYKSCFPEAVIDGFPVDLKHPAHHDFKNIKTLGIADKIRQSLGGTHASPTAHYRHGHFRVLRSERFTHMRGHVIFVTATFVNGRAKTVLTLEDTDKHTSTDG